MPENPPLGDNPAPKWHGLAYKDAKAQVQTGTLFVERWTTGEEIFRVSAVHESADFQGLGYVTYHRRYGPDKEHLAMDAFQFLQKYHRHGTALSTVTPPRFSPSRFENPTHQQLYNSIRLKSRYVSRTASPDENVSCIPEELYASGGSLKLPMVLYRLTSGAERTKRLIQHVDTFHKTFWPEGTEPTENFNFGTL